MFLVRGEGYEDFIQLFTLRSNGAAKPFTTSLSSKPETIIKKYKERSQIEQTHKELKSYLDAEGSYFRTKKSNYAHIFIVSLIHNIIQYLRLFLPEMSFKDMRSSFD
jgi:Archaeal putative transposase ISC1217.